jgi:hypothetical protein
MRTRSITTLPSTAQFTPTLLLDPDEARLEEANSTASGAVSYLRYARSHSQRIWKALRNDLPKRPAIVCEEEACRHLIAAMHITEAWARRLAARHSSLHWLWMLRRLPASVFTGTYVSTHGYDSRLAEVLTGLAPSRPGTVLCERERISYKLTQPLVDDLRQLCNATIYLSDLHVAYRLASKGAPIEFLPEFPPRAHASPELLAAVQLYDSRSATAARVPNSLGVGGTDPLACTLAGRGELFGIIPIKPFPITLPVDMFGVLESLVPTQEVTLHARFWPYSFSGEAHHRLSAIETRRQAAILILLHSAWLQTHRHVSQFHSVLTHGYLLVGPTTLASWIQEAMKELPEYLRERARALALTSSAEVLRTVCAIEGRAWPLLSGPLIRSDGEVVCVDLAAATASFIAIEAPSTNGSPANNRALEFEQAVQAVVDATQWKPPQGMRSLRGRTLKLNGRKITDIDAIASIQNQLLLISCKSVVYRDSHDAGEFTAIRSASRTVLGAVEAWQSKLEVFREHRRGDNYDFRGFDDIHGVVCTPNVVYVPQGHATEEVLPGLRIASSVSELEAWLRTKAA